MDKAHRLKAHRLKAHRLKAHRLKAHRLKAHTLFIERVLYFPISHSNKHRLHIVCFFHLDLKKMLHRPN